MSKLGQIIELSAKGANSIYLAILLLIYDYVIMWKFILKGASGVVRIFSLLKTKYRLCSSGLRFSFAFLRLKRMRQVAQLVRIVFLVLVSCPLKVQETQF